MNGKGVNEPFGLVSPCGNCPFLADNDKSIRKHLHPERTAGIIEDLITGVTSGFACHKTCNGEHEEDDEGEGRYIPGGGEMQCAGMLIMLEKMGRPTQNMIIAQRLHLYHPEKLEPHHDKVINYEDLERDRHRPRRR